MMEKRTFVVLFMLAAIALQGMADDAMSRLEEAISRRDLYVDAKVRRIDSIRSLIPFRERPEERLGIYNALFKEFLPFSFDSAMVYVDKAEQVAAAMDSYDALAQVRIHRAMSLATSGHFSHAISILNAIDSSRLPVRLREEYYAACEWTFGVWAEYSDKRTVAPELTARSLVYLDSLIAATEKDTPEYDYRKAEKSARTSNFAEAEQQYQEALDRVPVTDRLYAQAAYALAGVYKETGRKDKYREWLINAAISDQMVPLKENLALQQLALFIRNEEGDLRKANGFLKIALEDAVFYNNRLRMLEIAEKIPDITNVYQAEIEGSNRHLRKYIIIIGLLLALLCGAMAYVWRQHGKMKKGKKTVEELNGQLTLLNRQLSETNRSREQYVSLFMDLCAAYIDKLNRFPMVLKLKVKQLADMTGVADRYVRPSEAETKEMFFNFDSAFLRLYPDFITKFNALLREGEGIWPKPGELLNTDLRIYALVRMGITDSNKIATLLFLSPQTIFNHRTKVRNRARNRESFEKSVLEICPIMPK